jgi:acetylglutamate kinase
MKLTINITSQIINEACSVRKFAQGVASLVRDEHRVTIVHGDHETAKISLTQWRHDFEDLEAHNDCPAPGMLYDELLFALAAETRVLVSALSEAGISSFGFSGSDGGICQLRKKYCAKNQGCFTVETCGIDARWIDIICGNRGVPVLSNVVHTPWREHYLIDSDLMAAAFASGWPADALVYFVDGDGIPDLNGSVIRWLEVNDIELLEKQAVLNDDMHRKLVGCRVALKQGAARVRILPVSAVDNLAMLFFARISSGTEVFVAAS